jgi:hypothetical protein
MDEVSLAEAREDAEAATALRERAVEMGKEAAALRFRTLLEKAEALKASLADADEDAWGKYDALMDEIEEAKDTLYSLVSLALDGRYTAEDVRGWCSRAVEMGCGHPKIGGALLEDLLYVRKIPNAPFREYIEALETVNQIPVKHDKEQGDITKMVGLRTCSGGRNYTPNLRLFITYEQGVDLAQRFGMTPQAAGI